MKRFLVLALSASLVLGVIGVAEAKKKKPKAPVPVSLQFFLRADADCVAPTLSLTDGEDGDCIYGDGGLNDLYLQSGALDPVMHYVASDGLPLTLDAGRHITGTIGLRGWNGAGVGSAQVDIVLFGTIAGEEVELGSYQETYTAGPQEVKAIALDLVIDPKFAGAIVSALKLDVYSHGQTAGGRGVEHDEPISSITIPAFK
ncbi:MAG: hypothetical protein QOG04_1357 [Actinomycetota bacterium]|jgi:hypothetical protein|nr:hypothetical protein [Actinomycetota bacterium]